MPRVSSYTPPWLCRPSPGFTFFNKPSNLSQADDVANGGFEGELPKTLARRGNEIFAVVNNELRWSNLLMLKEQWERTEESRNHNTGRYSNNAAASKYGDEWTAAYRVLKVPVSRKIRQLVMSPAEDYLIIVTSHTAHVAVLPSSSHLVAEDMGPLKVKTFQLGPTIHVVERSPLAAVLWHPLGVQGNALVTVTADAVIRVWELDRKNRSSFDVPALDFDLKKLADGKSAAEDFSPSKYGTSKGFSPDSFEMEVASAIFSGKGDIEETPWSAMTLWVAMKAGDVYAVCPLLPSKFEAVESLTDALSSYIRCRFASLGDMESVSKQEKLTSDQQLGWISEIEAQQQQSRGEAVLQRPSFPGSIPRLQGPFKLAPDPDQVFDLRDIFVLHPTADYASQADVDGQDEYAFASFEIVCVSTSDAEVHVCVSLGAVEGAWLPVRKASRLLQEESDDYEQQELLIVETIDLSSLAKVRWPIFSPDARSCNSVFITHDHGVSHLDLATFTDSLYEELMKGTEQGVELRLSVLVENSHCLLEHPIDIRRLLRRDENPPIVSSSCVNLTDSELGNLLFTVAGGQPYAVTLEEDTYDLNTVAAYSDEVTETQVQQLITEQSRPTYQPPEEFWSASTLGSFMEEHVHGRGRRVMSEEVRLSKTTLQLLLEAHRVLSRETQQLGLAVADLFSRCQFLQDEFKSQITQAREVAQRIESVMDNDVEVAEEDEQNQPSNQNQVTSNTWAEAVLLRLEAVKDKQSDLEGRYKKLREKFQSINGRALSGREKAWVAEVSSIDEMTDLGATAASSQLSVEDSLQSLHLDDAGTQTKLSTRFHHVQRLKDQLTAESEELGSSDATQSNDRLLESSTGDFTFSIAPGRRKEKLAEVNLMLERQAALVEATTEKLERLKALFV